MATIEGMAEILSDEPVPPVQPGTALAIVPLSNLAVLPPVAPVQAETDEGMVLLWLDGLGSRTRRAYEADIRAFHHLVNKPLREIMLRDLQAYKAALAVVDEATGRPVLASATQARRLSSVKSLLTTAHELGYLALNIGSRVKLPPHQADPGRAHPVRRRRARDADPRARPAEQGATAPALHGRPAHQRGVRPPGAGSPA